MHTVKLHEKKRDVSPVILNLPTRWFYMVNSRPSRFDPTQNPPKRTECDTWCAPGSIWM